MNWLTSVSKTIGNLSIGWVDFVLLLLICVGIVRGRKRGLSEEILDTSMWIIIVVTAGMFYHTMGDYLNQKPILSKLTYYMFSYLMIAFTVKIFFVLLKKKFGAKLVESDLFGRMEFYGGMMAGAVRLTCVFLFVLSLLHAPYYSPEYLAKRAKEVDYNFGSDFFPHPSKFQVAVFHDSFSGKATEKYLGTILITPTEGTSAGVRNDKSPGSRREREMDLILGRR